MKGATCNDGYEQTFVMWTAKATLVSISIGLGMGDEGRPTIGGLFTVHHEDPGAVTLYQPSPEMGDTAGTAQHVKRWAAGDNHSRTQGG